MEGEYVKRSEADKQPRGLEEAADGFPPFEQFLGLADRVEERPEGKVDGGKQYGGTWAGNLLQPGGQSKAHGCQEHRDGEDHHRARAGDVGQGRNTKEPEHREVGVVHVDVVDLADEMHSGPVDDAAQQHKRHGVGRGAGPLPEVVSRAVGKRHADDQRAQFDAARNLIPVGGEERDDAQSNQNGAQDRQPHDEGLSPARRLVAGGILRVAGQDRLRLFRGNRPVLLPRLDFFSQPGNESVVGVKGVHQ